MADAGLSLYPNPAAETIRIRAEGSRIGQVAIMDMSGLTVYESAATGLRRVPLQRIRLAGRSVLRPRADRGRVRLTRTLERQTPSSQRQCRPAGYLGKKSTGIPGRAALSFKNCNFAPQKGRPCHAARPPDSDFQKTFDMKPTHIEHLGIAVKNLDESIKYYQEVLGLECYNIEEVKDQKVRTAFFKLGDTKLELLESTDPEGPIGKFVEKRGEGIHHIAFAVEDTQKALDDAAAKGVQLIDKNPRKGAENLNIGFLHPKSTHGVLTEFCCK